MFVNLILDGVVGVAEIPFIALAAEVSLQPVENPAPMVPFVVS